MGARKRLIRWWNERQTLARLTREAQEASARLGKAHEEAKGMDWEQSQYHTIEAWDEYSFISDQLEDALHARLVVRAYKYRVPIPQRTKDSADWEHSKTGKWRLTDEASHKLRRAVADEIELRQRPWLSWGPFVISGLGLVVAILALFGGAL